MAMKEWRAVYEYKGGLVRGAGACFAIAETEADARAQIEQAMPGVTILQISEEPSDPRAIYERRPRVLRSEVVCAEQPPANENTEPRPAVEW